MSSAVGELGIAYATAQTAPDLAASLALESDVSTKSVKAVAIEVDHW